MSKIGFNVLAWTANMTEDLYPIIERLKAIGYDGAEFFIGSPDERAYQKTGTFVQQLGMEATAVTVLGPDENPISPEKAVRLKALDRIKWAVDRAHDLQAKVLCGPFHSAHTIFAAHAPQNDEYQWCAEVLHQAGDYAAMAEVTFAMEALNRFECYLCNTMEQMDYLLQLVDHPNVRSMFDTHHANIEEKNLGQAISKISPRLAHVHISENDRGTPGKGHINFEEVFNSLANCDYNNWYTIEAFSRNDPAFANAINVWREYSDPWEIAEQGYTLISSQLQKHQSVKDQA